jgi:hypothetical protein
MRIDLTLHDNDKQVDDHLTVSEWEGMGRLYTDYVEDRLLRYNYIDQEKDSG